MCPFTRFEDELYLALEACEPHQISLFKFITQFLNLYLELLRKEARLLNADHFPTEIGLIKTLDRFPYYDETAHDNFGNGRPLQEPGATIFTLLILGIKSWISIPFQTILQRRRLLGLRMTFKCLDFVTGHLLCLPCHQMIWNTSGLTSRCRTGNETQSYYSKNLIKCFW